MNQSHDVAREPRQISAELNRQFPSAWKRFDEARSFRPARIPPPLTWLTYNEVVAAIQQVCADQNLATPLSVETTFDLYMLATWRVTQGVYRFDPELRAALAQTPLDLSLPASVLQRLPEWSVYVETPGMDHNGKAIAGVLGTTLQGPSGSSLMMMLIPESAASPDDDIDRLQFTLTDTPLRLLLAAQVTADADLRAQLKDTIAEYAALGVDLPDDVHRQIHELPDAVREAAIDAVLAGSDRLTPTTTC